MRLLCLLFSFVAASVAHKMVIIAPSLPPSQIMFNSRVADALANAGHDVTLAVIHAMDDFDNFPVKVSKNIKIHHVNGSTNVDMQKLEEEQGDMIFQDLPIWDSRMRKFMGHLMGLFKNSCRKVLQNKEFINWLKDSKFDLAFVHMYHLCPIGYVHAAGIPWIWLNSGGVMDFISDAVGAPMPASYVPPMMMASQDTMTLWTRIQSLIGHVLTKAIFTYVVAKPETTIFREEFDPNFPDLLDVAKNCSLVMTNTHAFYELPRPTLDKIVKIGGIGAQLKDTKPLPEELEKFVQEGEGAVVLTFGSVAPIHRAPESWKNAILKSFGRLPQYRFIMRYMGDDLNDRLPPNLKIMKWLPQSDLLQHPRVKAFISHGGYNGMQETIAAGKPIIMIPLAGDQPKNAKVAEKHGIALIVPKGEVTEEKLYNSIKEILSNPSYSNAAKRLSGMMVKVPVSAEQLLVKWSELMVEFKHLDNLMPAGQKLNFFQYHSLDSIAIISTVVLLFFSIVALVLKYIVRKVCRLVLHKKDKQE